MLKDLGTLAARENRQYFHTLLHDETLFKFDTLCDQVESTTTTHLNCIILVLGTYYFPVRARQNKSARCAAE